MNAKPTIVLGLKDIKCGSLKEQQATLFQRHRGVRQKKEKETSGNAGQKLFRDTSLKICFTNIN